MDSSFVIFGAFALFVVLASMVLLILWIALPFSVFGAKELIRQSIEEQERTNELLKTILNHLAKDRDKEIGESTEEKGDTL